MNTKLLASTLLAASLLAAPTIAFAQSETTAAPETKSEAAPPKAMHHHAVYHHVYHHMYHHMANRPRFEAGTTTGMSAATNPTRPGDRSIARRPAGN